MATIFVSYPHSDAAFVTAVVTELEARHDVRIDSKVPPGADYRAHQLADMRASDVALIFISDTSFTSDFQNAEIGHAQFCSAFVDHKPIIPIIISGAGRIPRPIENLDPLDLRAALPRRAAEDIESAIAHRARSTRLFISHAHRDEDIAARLVDVITARFDVPPGELRCTSVSGFQLRLGDLPADVLRRELGSAVCVITLLTPHSVGNDWVLFEVGAAWANAKDTLPLLAGWLQDTDIRGPLREAVKGQLTTRSTLDRLLDQLATSLGWRAGSNVGTAADKCEALVDYVRNKLFVPERRPAELRIDEVDPDVGPSFTLSGLAPSNEAVWIVVHPCRGEGYWVQPKAQSDGAGRWSNTVHLGEPGQRDHHGFYEIRVSVGVHSTNIQIGVPLKKPLSARLSSVPLLVHRGW